MKIDWIENTLLWISLVSCSLGILCGCFYKGIETGRISLVNELCQKQVYDFCQPETQTFKLKGE